ncbi:MAG: hypothetical protein JXR73_14420 [Candidatus Omnitrophica bacterium]|nr:hypothetical protein [Candidatus Omnitrophota bacterium]
MKENKPKLILPGRSASLSIVIGINGEPYLNTNCSKGLSYIREKNDRPSIWKRILTKVLSPPAP